MYRELGSSCIVCTETGDGRQLLRGPSAAWGRRRKTITLYLRERGKMVLGFVGNVKHVDPSVSDEHYQK